jgi:hypothetical protein
VEIALWLDRSTSIFWLGFLGKKAWRGRYVGGVEGCGRRTPIFTSISSDFKIREDEKRALVLLE